MFMKDNPLQRCELKFEADSSGEFEGYASVFNSNDAVGDTIAPGAFTKSLESGRMPSMFVNHDHSSIPVGDWVEMEQDEKGLFGRGVIDMNHKEGPTLLSAMRRKAMDGLSIGFTMNGNDWEPKSEPDLDGGRLIKNVDLREVSVVTFPCEDSARITGVKAEDFALFEDLKGLESFLRDSCGFSKSAAVAFVGRVLRVGRSDSPPREINITDDVTQLIRNLR